METMEYFKIAAEVCGGISAILALCLLFIKPCRKWLFGLKQIEEGQKCLLRSDMLRTYYKHRDEGEIRQYEYENFLTTYKAYRALGGNSFIEHVYEEVREWSVLP
jgi:hypothetical protein